MTSNRLAALVMAAGLALGPVCPGQVQPAKEPASNLPTTLGTPNITMEFPGGDLAHFVGVLRAATKEPVNIVLQGEASNIHVDAMTLRDVTVEAALRAGLEPRIGMPQIIHGVMSVILLNTVRPDTQGKPVFIVSVREDRSGTTRMVNAPVTEVLSILRLVKPDDGGATVPEQVVLSAIDSGLKLNQSDTESQPEINYHKDSGLLLVRGQPADVRMVQDIVRRMVDDQQRRGIQGKEQKRAEITRNAAMMRTQITAELAEQRLSLSEKRLSEINQQVAAGVASTRDQSEAQMACLQAQAELKMARVDMDRLNQEAKAGLDGGSDAAPDSRGGDSPDVAQLQAQLTRAMQRIKELEDQAAERKAPASGKNPAK